MIKIRIDDNFPRAEYVSTHLLICEPKKISSGFALAKFKYARGAKLRAMVVIVIWFLAENWTKFASTKRPKLVLRTDDIFGPQPTSLRSHPSLF